MLCDVHLAGLSGKLLSAGREVGLVAAGPSAGGRRRAAERVDGAHQPVLHYRRALEVALPHHLHGFCKHREILWMHVLRDIVADETGGAE